VRTGLSEVLGAESDIDIIGEAASGEEAIPALAASDADVAIVDYRLPGMNGIELCRELAEMGSQTAILVLSGHLDDEVAWRCLATGALGYVVKDADAQELKEAIRRVARGELYLDPKIASRVIQWAARAARGGNLLTPAVLRVLRLAVDGNTNQQIARKTGLSVHTVKSHLASAYRKLGVRDRAEAAAVAVRMGIL